MSKRPIILLLLSVIAFVFVPLKARAERPAKANEEIEFLLKQVEASNARFIREGKEYSPVDAVAHMRQKLSSAGDRVVTAEDFIDGIATKGYFSGKPYALLINGEQLPTGPWLKKKLAQKRAEK